MWHSEAARHLEQTRALNQLAVAFPWDEDEPINGTDLVDYVADMLNLLGLVVLVHPRHVIEEYEGT